MDRRFLQSFAAAIFVAQLLIFVLYAGGLSAISPSDGSFVNASSDVAVGSDNTVPTPSSTPDPMESAQSKGGEANHQEKREALGGGNRKITGLVRGSASRGGSKSSASWSMEGSSSLPPSSTPEPSTDPVSSTEPEPEPEPSASPTLSSPHSTTQSWPPTESVDVPIKNKRKRIDDSWEDSVAHETASARHAVVIPFVPMEMPKLQNRLSQWSQDGMLPCDFDNSEPNARNFDLVFYYSRKSLPSTLLQVRKNVTDALGDAIRCWSSVVVLSCNLSEEEELYQRLPGGQVKSLGPMYLLSSLFYRTEVANRYEYMLYMEVDVLQTQDMWMDKVEDIVHHKIGGDDFWVMGSPHRGEHGDSADWDYTKYYINGACTIFRVGDERLQQFVKDCIDMYGGPEAGHDIDMLLSTCRVMNDYSYTLALFHFTDAIYHKGSKWQYEHIPWDQQRQELPESVYFYHSTSLLTDVV